LILAGVLAAQAGERPACQPPAIGTAIVQAVLDGRTLKLSDGREVRLAGIEVSAGAAAAAARAALHEAVSGRAVALARLGPEIDRYGRLSALLSLPGGPSTAQVSVQPLLLAQGHARVAARVGAAACAADFLAAERAARAAGLGLWSDPYYLIRRAENPGELLAERGRFTVIEGRVLSVRESGGTIYLNFGRRWSEDFTVTVPKRSERSFVAAGLELRKLAGRRVRVRGMVEERGGPWIESMRPEQVEFAAGD
jgi:endonuclease YncB( thermonuclease family)